MVETAWLSIGVHKVLMGIAEQQPFETFGCGILAGRLLPNNGYPGIVLEYDLEGHVSLAKFQSFIPWHCVIAIHTHQDWRRGGSSKTAIGFAADIAKSLQRGLKHSSGKKP
jgi:hypothetical protein